MAADSPKKKASRPKKTTRPVKKKTSQGKVDSGPRKTTRSSSSEKVASPRRRQASSRSEFSPETSKKRASKEVYRIYERAVRLVYQKKHREAQSLLQGIQKKFPNEMEVLDRVNTLLRICKARLQKRKEDSPSTAEEFFDRGVVRHNRGLHEEALESFSAALKRAKKDSSFIHYAMAAAEVRLGNHERALKSLKKAIEVKVEHRFFARNDPDFEPLAKNETFRDLVRS